MSENQSGEASGLSFFFRLFVGLAAATSGGMLWLWATQQDQSWKYAPAIVCFCLAVAMCLPSPTGWLREILSRSSGVVLIAIGIAVAISLILSLIAMDGSPVWKSVVGLVMAIILMAIGWGRLFPNYYAPIPIDPEDLLMREAIEQARRELGRFQRGVSQGRKQSFAKFPLKLANGEVEHIWGIVHIVDDEAAHVSLANMPVHEPQVKDPRFRVPLAEIEDWMLVDHTDLVEGGYTHLALARIYKRERGYVPRAMKKDLARFQDLDLTQL